MTTRARAILSRLADAAKAKSDSALFRNMHDEPLRPYALREAFNGTLQRAGISDFHFHDLRHTFASRLVMAGVDLRTVQELMGHKTISMTLRYSHLSPDHKKSATNALEQRFPGKSPATFHNTPVSAPLSNVQKAV
jgi:site-specific recombinase XerD